MYWRGYEVEISKRCRQELIRCEGVRKTKVGSQVFGFIYGRKKSSGSLEMSSDLDTFWVQNVRGTCRWRCPAINWMRIWRLRDWSGLENKYLQVTYKCISKLKQCGRTVVSQEAHRAMILSPTLEVLIMKWVVWKNLRLKGQGTASKTRRDWHFRIQASFKEETLTGCI